MGWEHYQTEDPPRKKKRIIIIKKKKQISNKSIKPSSFHIIPQFNLSFQKKIYFPICPNITQNYTQDRKTLVNVLNRGNCRCLKRERDIGRKAMLRDVKAALTCYPALSFYHQSDEFSLKNL